MLFLFPHEEDWGDEWEAEDDEDGGGGNPLSPQDSVFSSGTAGIFAELPFKKTKFAT